MLAPLGAPELPRAFTARLSSGRHAWAPSGRWPAEAGAPRSPPSRELVTPCPRFRLVGGLASENVRWAESVENFRSQGVTLCGDVLLISAFVSYVGYFTKKYRNELMEKFWIPYVNKLKVSGQLLGKPAEVPRGGLPGRGSGHAGWGLQPGWPPPPTPSPAGPRRLRQGGADRRTAVLSHGAWLATTCRRATGRWVTFP